MGKPTTGRKPRKITIRRVVVAGVLAAAIALGWLLRGCLGIGIGEGDGQGDGVAEVTPLGDLTDAVVSPDSPPALEICLMRLSSKGLTLNGESVEITEAVRACKVAREVKLRVTGGARTGTYKEIERAFEEANVELHVSSRRFE